jgi:hypothetical protein
MSDWTSLAIEAAKKVGTPPDVMLATVEAETNGRNVMGDDQRDGQGPRAFGYGQVWLKWHFTSLEEAARILGVTLPGPAPKTAAEEVPFRTLILGNNELSMYLAAVVVRNYWSGAADFSDFVHSYVGPAVPDAEVDRRTALLANWRKSLGGAPGSSEDLVADVPGFATIRTAAGGFSVSTALEGWAALLSIGLLFVSVAAIHSTKEG